MKTTLKDVRFEEFAFNFKLLEALAMGLQGPPPTSLTLAFSHTPSLGGALLGFVTWVFLFAPISALWLSDEPFTFFKTQLKHDFVKRQPPPDPSPPSSLVPSPIPCHNSNHLSPHISDSGDCISYYIWVAIWLGTMYSWCPAQFRTQSKDSVSDYGTNNSSSLCFQRRLYITYYNPDWDSTFLFYPVHVFVHVHTWNCKMV